MVKTVDGAKESARKAAKGAGEAADARFDRIFGSMHAEAIIHAISSSTQFDVKEGIVGYWQTFHQVVTLQPAELTAFEEDLEYVHKRLKQAEEPIQEMTWQDARSSWMQLAQLLPKIRSERGIAILQSIFSDKKVVQRCML